MRAPESTGKLDTVETNPLPHVSSARAWDALEKGPPRPSRPLVSLPKAAPVIREKPRADRTEEICAEDIMVIVPPRAVAPSSEELDDSDLEIEVEHTAPVIEEFRPPAFSVHATQEILVDDVIEVANAPLPPPPPVPYFAQPEERPSSIPPPWTVDAHAGMDEFEFPTPPQYSGPHPAMSARITAFSATQVFRRRSANMKVVIGSLSLAASVVLIAGIARLAPNASLGSSSEGPVGISVHAPKKLDTAVRGRTLAYGHATRASQVPDVAAISIDSLPLSRARARHY